jgi:hypothetical protein
MTTMQDTLQLSPDSRFTTRDSLVQINLFFPSFSPIQNRENNITPKSPIQPDLRSTNNVNQDIQNLGDAALQQLADIALSVMRTWGVPSPPAPPITQTGTEASTSGPLLQPSTRSLPTSPILNQPLQQLVTSRDITPDIYSNARFEQIACAGLSVKFDGTAENLIPTLDLIHICRLNEVWNSAT